MPDEFVLSPDDAPHVARYEPESLQAMLSALWAAERQLLELGTAQCAKLTRRNIWLDATAWFAALTDLALPSHLQPAVLWTGHDKHRTRSQLLAVDRDAATVAHDHAEALPPLPEELATFRLSLGLRHGETPPGPSWVHWRVPDLVDVGPTPEAAFQVVWLHRSVAALLPSHDWTGRRVLVDGPAELPPRWRLVDPSAWPREWGVTVWSEVRLFENADLSMAPRQKAPLENIGGQPCTVVEYYTMRRDVEVYRHRDWCRGSRVLAREDLLLATSGDDPFATL
jgi:hypothetical protein